MKGSACGHQQNCVRWDSRGWNSDFLKTRNPQFEIRILFDNLTLPRLRGFPSGYRVFPISRRSGDDNGKHTGAEVSPRVGNQINEHKQGQKEEAKEENGAGNLPRPQTVLDHPNSVLAVGEGRRCYQDTRQSPDWNIQTGTRGAFGFTEQYRLKSGSSESHARSIDVSPGRAG